MGYFGTNIHLDKIECYFIRPTVVDLDEYLLNVSHLLDNDST